MHCLSENVYQFVRSLKYILKLSIYLKRTYRNVRKECIDSIMDYLPLNMPM